MTVRIWNFNEPRAVRWHFQKSNHHTDDNDDDDVYPLTVK